MFQFTRVISRCFSLSTPRKLRVEKEGFRKHVARAVSSPYPRSPRSIDRPATDKIVTVSKFYGAVRPFRDKLLFGRVSTRLWNVSNTRSKQFTDVNHDPRGDPRENLSEASRFVSRLIIFFIKEESFFLWKREMFEIWIFESWRIRD